VCSTNSVLDANASRVYLDFPRSPFLRSFSFASPCLANSFLARDTRHRWFRQHHYQSFQRQLNIYGFRRIKSGPDKGCYYHPLFLRSRPDLCKHIQRKQNQKQKKTKKGLPAAASSAAMSSSSSSSLKQVQPEEALKSSSSEPRFYEMPYLPRRPAPPSAGHGKGPPSGETKKGQLEVQPPQQQQQQNLSMFLRPAAQLQQQPVSSSARQVPLTSLGAISHDMGMLAPDRVRRHDLAVDSMATTSSSGAAAQGIGSQTCPPPFITERALLSTLAPLQPFSLEQERWRRIMDAAVGRLHVPSSTSTSGATMSDAMCAAVLHQQASFDQLVSMHARQANLGRLPPPSSTKVATEEDDDSGGLMALLRMRRNA